MCGITGFVNFDGHPRDEAEPRIKRMNDTLLHRGPDADGVFVDEHAALGHRRLSIIDLKTGQQPMAALNGQVQIVFNGEIYNFEAVRQELEGLGHTFLTRSDTEVILAAYVEWGRDCLPRLNGMFAFAIWDRRHRTLFLARDRVGKKPLYYVRKGSLFAFASEIKALRAYGDLCRHQVDGESLDCYLSFGYVPAPRTIYKDVYKLEAGHSLTITESGNSDDQYWKLQFSGQTERSMPDAVDEFTELLDDAVRCRLMSEVPLGAFLSGGIDSSLVVSSMSRMTNTPVITHTIGLSDRDFDETVVARKTAEFLGTDHHEYIVEPDANEVIDRIAWHFDEPFADSSALPTWYVCEMTRQSVTVALSGDGGDEGFGGYTFRYLPHLMESRIRKAIPASLRSLMFGPLGALWPGSAKLPRPLRLKTILNNLCVSDATAFYRDLIWLNEETRSSVYNPEFLKSLKGFTPFEVVEPRYHGNDAKDPLGRSQFADVNVYMTDDVLVKVDRMSMAHSLEVRAPLLDYRILEFGANLPTKLKVSSRQGKLVLRELAARRLPSEIRKLPKQGFSVPIARWIRQDLKEFAHDILFSDSDLIQNSLDSQALKQIWSEHQSGSRDHNVFLWGVIMLGLWDRNYG
ncbi:MAG: asparagine synthase (glutamine-hydrolyzing) [Rhodothermales bacterium]|nr:asparagine synthase (glutamine-hydrolyzing) [Rhodothermales bacterium]